MAGLSLVLEDWLNDYWGLFQVEQAGSVGAAAYSVDSVWQEVWSPPS